MTRRQAALKNSANRRALRGAHGWSAEMIYGDVSASTGLKRQEAPQPNMNFLKIAVYERYCDAERFWYKQVLFTYMIFAPCSIAFYYLIKDFSFVDRWIKNTSLSFAIIAIIYCIVTVFFWIKSMRKAHKSLDEIIDD